MKTILKGLMMVMAIGATMTSCVKDDLDMTQTEKAAKASYAENFSKKYPNVSLNQNWDFSSKYNNYTLGEIPVMRSLNRATEVGKYAMNKDWYEVDNQTLDWMHEKLVEGENHTSLGRPFYMKAPGNDFTIVPIYQGQAGAMWDLHVVIGGVDYKVWEKINFETLGGTEPAPGQRAEQNETEEGTIQIKDLDSDEWHNMHGQWYDWGYGHWSSLYNTDGSDRWTPDWSDHNKVTAVRSRSYTFTGFPVGTEMYFYLDITADGNERNGETITRHYQDVGDQQTSLKGMMLALTDCPVPANLTGNQVMIVGCEDADKEGSDWDLNDLVLLVYGQRVPQPVEIKEGETINEVKTVRYMIEDLGATDDFDFNDIVVDVSEIRSITPTYTVYSDKTVTTWKETGYRQEATIRHLGGTLPFILTIGDTELQERQGVLGADPDETLEVSGWDINRHNVSIKVRQSANSGVYNNVSFPKAGEAPMIIAVDPSTKWMAERVSVPETWFYVP
ncbi:MAG: hypothetical protein IJ069_11910 [Prevotella sp.]|nr:hypothetical protein [Prevotella sp.]